jgi:DNA-binding GntR family transcriptional regulator
MERAMTETQVKEAPWPHIEASTLADRVYQIIRNRILQRELVPGSFIREQDVSRAIGVSRTPVREALNRLASQDFLERVPHRGFRVPDDSWATLLEVYPIVTALEVLAGTLAFPQLRREDVKRLRELNRKLEAAGVRGDAKGGVELNNAFHQVFSERSGNARLAELLDQLRTQVILLDVWYFSVPQNVVESVREHDEIADAVEAGDQARALEALERNYIRGRQTLEAELSRQDALPAGP